MQVQLCLSRGLQRLRGDMVFFTITVSANLVIALALGSIYYDLAPTAETLNSKCILLYFAILFNALSCALEVSRTPTSFVLCPLLIMNERVCRSSRSMYSVPSWRSIIAMPYTTHSPKQFRR